MYYVDVTHYYIHNGPMTPKDGPPKMISDAPCISRQSKRRSAT